MSEQNKAVVGRFYEEVFNKRNANVIDELSAPNFIDHTAAPGQAPGATGVKDMTVMFQKAFPDLRVTVEEIVAERDIVVARFSMEGTHRGELFGTAATGKRVTFRGLDMVRIKDGKATEVWHYGDDMVVMSQLGVRFPAPTA